MKWSPLIEDSDLRNSILQTIDIISESLYAISPDGIGLLVGAAGISFFWEYLYLHDSNIKYRYYSNGLINSSLDCITTTPMSYNLSGGISGVLWAYRHLMKTGAIKSDGDIIGNDVRKFLMESAKVDLIQNNYDYLHGGLSPLPFFLEDIENEQSKAFIQEMIVLLENIAERDFDKIAWFEGSYFIEKNIKRYNLGLSHGMPSIIILLSKALENNIDSITVENLMSGCINWILNKFDKKSTTSYFPTFYPSNPPYYSRVSWCYGDLGIVLSLFEASLVTNNISWREEAIKIAINVSQRKIKDSGIQDACLCHGTAGNAHIFNRLYNYTGKYEFKEAAIYWYMETIQFYRVNKHFKITRRDENGGNERLEDSFGLLEGIAGIGLSLIASISEIEPKWDRVLLLS